MILCLSVTITILPHSHTVGVDGCTLKYTQRVLIWYGMVWQIVQHTYYNTYYTYYNYYSQTSKVTLLSDSAICTSISQQGWESGSHLADNWVGWLRNLPCGAGVLWPDWWRTHQTALLALATTCHRTAPVWKRKITSFISFISHVWLECVITNLFIMLFIVVP